MARALIPNGRVPVYCKPGCRTSAFGKRHRGPKVSFEDRVAARMWQALADAKLVTGELPPKRSSGDV